MRDGRVKAMARLLMGMVGEAALHGETPSGGGGELDSWERRSLLLFCSQSAVKSLPLPHISIFRRFSLLEPSLRAAQESVDNFSTFRT